MVVARYVIRSVSHEGAIYVDWPILGGVGRERHDERYRCASTGELGEGVKRSV